METTIRNEEIDSEGKVMVSSTAESMKRFLKWEEEGAQSNRFLSYLVKQDSMEFFLSLYEDMKNHESAILETQEAIETGTVKGYDNTCYSWTEIQTSDGQQAYNSQEEWESEERAYIEQEKEGLIWSKTQIEHMWNEYLKVKKSGDMTMEQEIEKIFSWKKRYD